jgi:hypothetical protein
VALAAALAEDRPDLTLEELIARRPRPVRTRRGRDDRQAKADQRQDSPVQA